MLCDLPDEVLIHIFSFLRAREQILTIPRVCQRFRALTDTEWFWRAHFMRLRGGVQPMVELESMRLWQEGCLQRELALALHRNTAAQDLLQGTIVLMTSS